MDKWLAIPLRIIMAGLLLTACEKGNETEQVEPSAAAAPSPVVMRPVESAAGKTVSEKPLLRERLPDSAFAYARLPSVWAILGAPTGGTLDTAVGSAPYAKAVRSIREGVDASLVPALPESPRLLARLLLQHATSPIEAAALPASDPTQPLPQLLITAAVDFADLEELNGLLAELATGYPAIQVVQPVRQDTPGRLSVAGMEAQVSLDTEQSRLYVLIGSSLAPRGQADTLSTLRPNPHHPMLAREAAIDSSGQGLFVWADPSELMRLASLTGQQDQAVVLALFGMNTMKGVAFGMGASGGIHRLKAVLEMPHAGFRAFLPVMADTPTFELAGKPKWVVTIGVPGPGDLASIEAAFANLTSPENMKGYQDLKASFEQRLGFSLEELLGVVGQDISFASDEAGQYMAIRVKDAERLQSMIDQLAQRFELTYDRRNILGRTYHHLVIPSVSAAAEGPPEAGSQPDERAFMRLFATPTHVYWVRDGDYLIAASLPQALIDRGYITHRTRADAWLRDSQRMDPRGALLLSSMSNEGLPAMMYRLNLELLGYLGDLAGRPVDMFALPTPREAGLPEQGAFSAKISSSESELAIEIAFESNPLEILMAGNGYYGLATAGVLAAIAIPAYQEYILTARLETGMDATGELRAYVEGFAEDNGRFPDAQEIATLDLSRFQTDHYTLSVNPNNGEVIVDYHVSGLDPDGSRLTLTPQQEDDRWLWACGGTLEQKQLPTACR